MSYGTLSGGRGGMGSPYSDLSGVGSWGLKVPSVVRNPIAVLSKPLSAMPMLTKPIDRFIPGPLARMIPGGGATALTAMTGNPLLAVRAVQLRLKPTAIPAGHVPDQRVETQQLAETFPGRCILAVGPFGFKVVSSWRIGTAAGSWKSVSFRAGVGQSMADCRVTADGTFVPGSISGIVGGAGPVARPLPQESVNGLGFMAQRFPSRGPFGMKPRYRRGMPVSGLGILPAPTAMPVVTSGPPADATKITEGVVVDMSRGDIWIGPTKVAILPAVFSAIAVKVILFGGSYAGNKAREAFTRRKAATA